MKNTFRSGLLVGTNLLLMIFLFSGAVNKPVNSEEESNSESLRALEPYLGEITMFAGNFAPRGWAFCDGQLLAISQNSALFSLLGTIYGGDGRTTFALPDLRGRVPVHAGRGPGLSDYRQGQKGGNETQTLAVRQLPAHNHAIFANENVSNTKNPEGAMLANPDAPMKLYSDQIGQLNMRPTGNTGGNQAVDIRQPYATVRYIIAVVGTYPSRN